MCMLNARSNINLSKIDFKRLIYEKKLLDTIKIIIVKQY